MKIAIAGGTGTVGRHVVRAAHERGHDVVVLSRKQGVDVLGDVGIARSIEGADVVIDVLNTTPLSTGAARAFFSTATSNLLAAEAQVGTAHHITLSVVGIDDIDTSYYADKIAQERLVHASDVPHTVARTAQFHEFAEQVASQTTIGPVTVVPRTLTRPVAARDVADHLVRVAETEPAGRAPDLVGPQDATLADMVRRMYEHDGSRRRVLDVRFPGAYGRGLASGALRGGPDGQSVTETTFDQWLESADHRG